VVSRRASVVLCGSLLLAGCDPDRIGALALASCSSLTSLQDSDVDEGLRRWSSALAKAHPLGRDPREVVEELGAVSGDLYWDGGMAAVFLESFPGDGCVCSAWYLRARFDLGADGEVVDYEIVPEGACL
jgi:hypothetical protein